MVWEGKRHHKLKRKLATSTALVNFVVAKRRQLPAVLDRHSTMRLSSSNAINRSGLPSRLGCLPCQVCPQPSLSLGHVGRRRSADKAARASAFVRRHEPTVGFDSRNADAVPLLGLLALASLFDRDSEGTEARAINWDAYICTVGSEDEDSWVES